MASRPFCMRPKLEPDGGRPRSPASKDGWDFPMTEDQRHRVQISVTAHSAAPRAEVFRLLKDGRSWPRWSLFDSFRLERKGVSDPLGVGAIRVLETRVSTAREEVTAIDED